MKPTALLLGVAALFTSAAVADKTCTPSFDYCANELMEKKGQWIPGQEMMFGESI